MKILITTASILLVAASLTSCNTVEGVGKDVKGAGRSIEHTAERTAAKN